jgi:hypothetical protein
MCDRPRVTQAYGRGKEVRESQQWEQKGYYQLSRTSVVRGIGSFIVKWPRCSKLHIHGQGPRPFLQGEKGFHNLLKIKPSSLFMFSEAAQSSPPTEKAERPLPKHKLTCVQHPTHVSPHYINRTSLRQILILWNYPPI